MRRYILTLANPCLAPHTVRLSWEQGPDTPGVFPRKQVSMMLLPNGSNAGVRNFSSSFLKKGESIWAPASNPCVPVGLLRATPWGYTSRPPSSYRENIREADFWRASIVVTGTLHFPVLRGTLLLSIGA